MIVSRTPFRVSFAGGGSDLRAYYARRPGAVVSAAIDKYMYVTVNRRFDPTIRISYTKTEIVDRVNMIQHDLVRETMAGMGLDGGIELTTIADVPAGTGLGSSSSLTVGLLHALYAFQGKFRSAQQLAQEACHVETGVLKRPIGKQDQYAAAYGGLNYLQFNPDETVFVEPIICSQKTRKELERRLLMFYVGVRGDSSKILSEQRQATLENAAAEGILDHMVALARKMKEALNNNDLCCFGRLLHENWVLKKQMNSAISNADIDRWYEAGRDAGTIGGKILGAGGAGFLLFFCQDGAQELVRARMRQEGLREFPVRFEPEGSKIIFIGNEQWVGEEGRGTSP